MNNYNINTTAKKTIGQNITKTTINISPKTGKHMTMADIANIVDVLNKSMDTKQNVNSKFVVVASSIFNKNFNIKGYADKQIRFNSISDYLDGRVKDETKFGEIDQITITMIQEKI